MFQMNANLLQLLHDLIMSNYNLQSSIHMNFVESRAIFLLVCVHGMAIFLLMFVHGMSNSAQHGIYIQAFF